MHKLKIRGAFGEPIEGEYSIGAAKVHGYECDGSWSLYGGEGWIPCTFVQIKTKRQRKWRWIMKSQILEGFPN